MRKLKQKFKLYLDSTYLNDIEWWLLVLYRTYFFISNKNFQQSLFDTGTLFDDVFCNVLGLMDKSVYLSYGTGI